MSQFNVKKLVLPNGNTVEKQLKIEAKRFLNILQEEIEDWYHSQSEPMVYDRTGAMLRSLNISNYVYVNVNTNKLCININFNNNAIRDSLFSDEKVNILTLLNEGYEVKKDVWFKEIDRFGTRDGGMFIENAIAKFNENNVFGVDIKVNY